MGRRPGYATIAILKAVASGYRHGFDIIDATGLPGGTVYPALGRLESEGCVASRWEDPAIARREGRPPRRYYELRPAGRRRLEAMLRELKAIESIPRRPRLRPRLRKA